MVMELLKYSNMVTIHTFAQTYISGGWGNLVDRIHLGKSVGAVDCVQCVPNVCGALISAADDDNGHVRTLNARTHT